MQISIDTKRAKSMARILGDATGKKLGHGQALDALARMLGCADWNGLAAALAADAADRTDTAPAALAAARPAPGPATLIDDGDEDPLYLTNGCCEHAHGDEALFAALGLEAGVCNGDWYPLTDREARYIADDLVDIPCGGALTGYAVLWKGQKWLCPSIEFGYQEERSADDSDLPDRDAALAEARRTIAALDGKVAALGGRLRLEADECDSHHTLQILIPFATAFAAARGWEDWKLFLQRALGSGAFRVHDALSGRDILIAGAILNAPGAALDRGQAGRAFCLIAEDGTTLVARENRSDPEVTAMLHFAKRQGVRIGRRQHLVDRDTLVAAWRSAGIAPDAPVSVADPVRDFLDEVAHTPLDGEPDPADPRYRQIWNPSGDPDHAKDHLHHLVRRARTILADLSPKNARAKRRG